MVNTWHWAAGCSGSSWPCTSSPHQQCCGWTLRVCWQHCPGPGGGWPAHGDRGGQRRTNCLPWTSSGQEPVMSVIVIIISCSVCSDPKICCHLSHTLIIILITHFTLTCCCCCLNFSCSSCLILLEEDNVLLQPWNLVLLLLGFIHTTGSIMPATSTSLYFPITFVTHC